ncbi:MAG TPA: hypothetical protein VG099_27880, partial [Gemmataceae bacterium]|nr:hypothetical protein [Gemmataceae bacterium]
LAFLTCLSQAGCSNSALHYTSPKRQRGPRWRFGLVADSQELFAFSIVYSGLLNGQTIDLGFLFTTCQGHGC